MPTTFYHLPFELRLTISTHLKDWSDFLTFRNLNSANRALLSSAGVMRRFSFSESEKNFLQWFRTGLQAPTTTGMLMRTLVASCSIHIEAPSFPLTYEYEPNNAHEFIRTRSFHEKGLKIANRRTIFPGTEDVALNFETTTIQPSLQTAILGDLSWAPLDLELHPYEISTLHQWSHAIICRVHFWTTTIDGIVQPAPLPSHFERCVVTLLGITIQNLHDEYVASEWDANWVPLERVLGMMFRMEELFIFVMRVNGWESLANGVDSNPCFNSASYTINSSFDLDDEDLYFGPLEVDAEPPVNPDDL